MAFDLVPLAALKPDRPSSIGPVARASRRARGVPELARVTAEEIARATAAAAGPAAHPARWDVLLVRFLWVSGARISEALAVTPHDFDFQAPCVRLRTLKRKFLHYRALPLPPAFVGELAQRFMWSRPGPGDPIFPWRRSQAYEVVRRVLMAGGVDAARAHPHAIRHGHAFHALAGGVPVSALQAAFGHARLATTAIYARATGADIKAAYDRVQW